MASASPEPRGRPLSSSTKEVNTTVYPETIEERRRDGDGKTSIYKYTRGKLLGKGGFAKCFVGTLQNTRSLYALKIVSKASLTKSRAKQKLQSEIKIHKTLAHAHVVKFERFFEDSAFAYIVLELCPNNSMSELLKRRKKLDEFEVKYYLLQLVNALGYLHRNCIIHRDLKLGNLFISSEMQVKVGDFGLATRVTHVDEKKRTVCGTPNYIAPEILDGKDGHSYEVDIWSTGVVVYTLLVGRPPFESKNVHSTYKRILANSYSFPEPSEPSDSARSIIRCMLQPQPHQRPKLGDILNHSFLNPLSSIPTTLSPSLLREPHTLTSTTAAATASGLKGLISSKVTDENEPVMTNLIRDDKTNIPISHSAPEKRPHVADTAGLHYAAAEKRPLIDMTKEYKPRLSGGLTGPVKKPFKSSAPLQSMAKLIPTSSKPLSNRPLFDIYSDPVNKPFSAKKDTPPTRSAISTRASNNRALVSSTKAQTPHSSISNQPNARDACVYDNEDLNDIQHDMNNVKLDDKLISSASGKRRVSDPEAWAWTDDDDIMGLPGNAVKVAGRRSDLQTPKLSGGKKAKEVNTIEQMYGTLNDGLVNGDVKSGRGQQSAPSGTAGIWVSRYVDYTSKYGLGFLLNTGSTGVYFNDSTKIVLSGDGSVFQYIERRRSSSGGILGDHSSVSYPISGYPPELHKKVTLLKHFGSYLVEQEKEEKSGKLSRPAASLNTETVPLGTFAHTLEPADDVGVLPYLKKWVRTRHAILFRLSNKTVQVVFFDKSEVLLSSEAHMVTFVDKAGTRSEHLLQDVLLTGRVDIAKRLKCTKDIMYRLMSMQTK